MAHSNSGIPSAAHVQGHPIHPMLIPFPIAYLIGALATDLAYLSTADPFWARASLWLLGAGLVMGAAAATFGLIDFYSRAAIRDHKIAWHHFIGNATVLVLALINVIVRADAPIDGIAPGGVTLSLITAGILAYTGWLGGEMAYRFHIGAVPASMRRPAETVSRDWAGERRFGPDDRRGHPAM